MTARLKFDENNNYYITEMGKKVTFKGEDRWDKRGFQNLSNNLNHLKSFF